MQNPIGAIIEYDGHLYQVVASKDCKRCALYNCDCFSLNHIFGECEFTNRKDYQNVIFKKIKHPKF